MQVSYNPATLEMRREFFMGEKARDVYDAMDERKAQLEQSGERVLFRTKIGRNATCPCGSGRKFKKCCIERSRLVGIGTR